MVIAVTYDELTGGIGEHFGHATHMKFYEVDENGIVQDTAVLPTANYGQGHAAMAELLQDYYTDALICRNIGKEAMELLLLQGINVYRGAKGSADEAVHMLLANLLQPSNESNCSSCGGACGSSCTEGSCGGCAGCR